MAPAAANQRIQAALSRIEAAGHTHEPLQIYRQTANEPCFYRADRREILNFLVLWFHRLEAAALHKGARKKNGLIFPSVPETATGLLSDFDNFTQALARVEPAYERRVISLMGNQPSRQARLTAKERAAREYLPL